MTYTPKRRYGLDPQTFAALERQLTGAAERMTKEQLLDLADALHAAVRRHSRESGRPLDSERTFGS
ncbi:MAG: hypothetical protein IT546_02205 [Caulobacteraceae bacterium]|nr:hypothetical protein [Caulobacteraceae bacterium]